MKKTIIIGVATMLLITASPVYARENGNRGNEHGNRGQRGNSGLTATSSTQMISIKAQIEALKKQLEELRRTSHATATTIAHNKDNDDKMSEKDRNKSCAQFANKHRHQKSRGRGLGYYRVFDQNFPAYCAHLPTFSTSTISVVDDRAPIVSNILISAVSTTSASINWTTNENASSKLFLSTSSPVQTTGTPFWTDSATTTGHGVQLTALIPNTTYYYVIQATDLANNTRSSQGSFATGNLGDITAPLITNITAGDRATSSVVLTWKTDESATSKVFLSTVFPTPTTSATWSDIGFLSNHSTPLTGLAASTTYYYIIQATDASNNTSFSTQGSFITAPLDITAPVISAIATSSVTANAATVTWTTDENADGIVYYSTSTPVATSTAHTSAHSLFVTSHEVHLTGLTASSTYYMIVSSQDISNNRATSTQVSFTTTN